MIHQLTEPKLVHILEAKVRKRFHSIIFNKKNT